MIVADFERRSARVFWLVSAGLLVLLGLWLALALYNRFDEPLDSDTQAWLGYPLPTANPDQNAFIDQIALSSRSHLPRTAAFEWLLAAHALHENDAKHALEGSPDVFGRLYRHFLFPLDVDPPKLANCKPDCYDDIVARRGEFEPYLMSLAPQLARYDAMVGQPDYAEDLIPDLAAIGVGYADAPKLDRLYLSRMVYRLEDGQAAEAFVDWQRRQQFWLRVAGQASTLFGQMQALAALERGEELLVEMLARHPEALEMARIRALPALADEGAKQIRAQFARVLVYELRFSQDGYTRIGFGSWLDHHGETQPNNIFAGFWGLVGISLYQPNATLNLARQAREHAMAVMGLRLDGKPLRHFSALERMCLEAGPGMPFTLRNPFGKHLVCRAAGVFSPLGRRLDAYADATRKLRVAVAGNGSLGRFQQLATALPLYLGEP